MGQLERYGLYVLCLVIFLILGIAIWGDSTGPQIPHDPTGPLTATSGTGPGDVISQQRLKELEDEANLNDVVKIIDAASEPVELPLQRVVRNTPASDPTSDPMSDNSRNVLPVRPVTPKVRIHVVKQFETLEEISLRHLGKRRYWRQILAFNPGVRPTALRPGMKLKIPPRQTDAGGRSTMVPTMVIVQRGDSPGLISQRLFGTTKYAKEIMRLNNIDDPRKLQIGAQLKVPQVDMSKAKR